MVLNWMELDDDDQDSLVIWKMGQFDFSFRGVACKGSGTAEAAGKESSPFHRQTGSPRISPVTGIPTMYIFLSALCTERRLAQCCPGGAGAMVGGKGQNGFYQRIGR